MKTQNQICLNLSRITSYKGTLRHAGNTGMELLQFLKANNDLHKDVTIVHSNIPPALVDSLENENVELADVDSAKENLEPVVLLG